MRRKFRVMWVDDKISDSDCELLLRELKSAGVEDCEIVPSSAPSDTVVEALDADRPVDVVVFDWRYESTDSVRSPIDPRKVLKLLLTKAPQLPIILYSGVANAADIQPFPNVRAFVPKEKLDELVAKVKGYLLREWPTIMHVSDLHFGIGHGHAGRSSYESLLESLQHEADYLSTKRPNMLIVSGDLTSKGSRDEFAQARDFVAALATMMKLSRDRVYVVPGNHDVQLSEAYSYNNYYEEFVQRFYRQYPAVVASHLGGSKRSGDKVDQDDLAWVRSTDGIACTAIALNSVTVSPLEAHRVDKFELGTVGNVQTAQLSGLAERLRTFGRADGVRLAILHHQLFPVPSRRPGNTDEAFKADNNRVVIGQASLLNWLDEQGVQIVLHGHSHYAAARTVTTHYTGRWRQGGQPIHVVAAGTTGASALVPAHSEHCYTLLQVTDASNDRRLEVCSRVLSPDSSSWRTEPGMQVSVGLPGEGGTDRR